MSKKSKPNKKNELSGSRKFVFKIILMLLPVLFFILMELLLRLFHYGDSYKMFISHPDEEYSKYNIVNPEIGKKHFRKFEYTQPSNDIFLKDKPENCFRIFVMGSSTVVGFPYDRNLMFSRILHQRLQDAYPEKRIEVINTAITAQNSFSLRDFIPEILKQEPDAILIYAGHNEFYGAFGVGSNEATGTNNKLTPLHLRLLKLRIYQLIQNTVTGVASAFRSDDTSLQKRGTLMKRIVNKTNIVYGSELYNKGMEYYEVNLNAMLAMAGVKDVPVFVSNLVCNLRDLPPFESVDTLGLPKAIDVYQEARKAEKSGDYKSAKALYSKARDLDCVRFRASADANKIIDKVVKEYKAYYVPMLEYFEAESENGLVGNNLMTEHVHPNIEGYFLMSDAFFDAIVNSGLVNQEVNKFFNADLSYYKRNWGYTTMDSLLGDHRITNLSYYWPFRDETEETVDYRLIYKPVSPVDSLAFEVMRNSELSGADAHYQLAGVYENAGMHYKAFREYNALVKINPYWAEFYRNAATSAIQIQDLSLALDYLNESLIYDKNFYAYFRAGEIYLIRNDLKNAVQYFRTAYEMAPPESRVNVLQKLYIAYAYGNQTENAGKIRDLIRQYNPSANTTIPPKSYTYMEYVPIQVQGIVQEAKKRIIQGNLSQAMKLLQYSLKIKESGVANRLLGELNFNLKKPAEAKYYFEKVLDEFGSDPRFLHSLMLTYLMNGENNRAEWCLEEIAVAEPNYPMLPKLKQLITK